MADARDLAAYLRKKIQEAAGENHRHMDGGLAHDIYMKVVGRQAALTEVKGMIAEGLTAIEKDEGNDSE